MRVAIIEDNESVAKGIAYRMQDRGHAADIISDGRDAELFLRGDDNDVVILDINLPGCDGITLLKAMRARGRAAGAAADRAGRNR
ncbi:MAG: response regulator [Silicimonas sp.]|nr:response regulator [Silicimonas sp.]